MSILLGLFVVGLALTSALGTVSLTETAAPLTRLMPVLADLTHHPLKASKAVEGEVLCIDVHDVDTGELLKRIAQATGCEWLKKADGTYLVPNEEARNGLTREGVETRISQLEKLIEEFNPAGKSTPPQNDSPLKTYQSDVSPIFYTLLKGIGAETIAAIPPGERIVLSSHPTARQSALPPLGPNDISDYVETQNKARKELVTNGDVEHEAGSPITGRVAKVDFVLERNDIFESTSQSGIGASLVLYDSAGKELDRNYLPVDHGLWGAWYVELLSPETNAPMTPEKPIKISAAAVRFAQAERSHPGIGAEAPLQSRKIVEEELRHPELHDPLAYPSELLTGASEAKHLQLVASLPDSFSAWQDLLRTPITPSQAIEFLKRDSGVHLESGDGWMILSPTDFSIPQMDRKELADLSKRFRGKVSWPLDDLIDLDRAGLRNPAREILLDNWLGGGNDDFTRFEVLQDWKFVHFVSTLNPALRATLNKNQSLSVGDLGLESRDALDDAVYGFTTISDQTFGPLHVELEVPYGKQPDVEHRSDIGTATDFRSEPTEVAPNGLPSDATVVIKAPRQTILLPAAAGSANWDASPTNFRASSLERFATLFAMSEPGLAPAASSPRLTMTMNAFAKCYIGTEMAMDFRVYAGPESFKTGKIVTRSVSLGDTCTPKTLPTDMQADFDKLVRAEEALLRASPYNRRIHDTFGPP